MKKLYFTAVYCGRREPRQREIVYTLCLFLGYLLYSAYHTGSVPCPLLLLPPYLPRFSTRFLPTIPPTLLSGFSLRFAPGLIFRTFTFLPVLYWVAFVCGLSHTNTSRFFPRRVVLAIYLSLPPSLVLFCSSLPRPPATS